MKMNKLSILPLMMCLAGFAFDQPKLAQDGIVIDFGIGGKITLQYPKYVRGGKGDIKPVVQVAGQKAMLSYPHQENDTPVMTITQDGVKFKCRVAGRGSQGQFKWECHLPYMWAGQGTYEFPAGSAPQTLPKTYVKGAHETLAGETYEKVAFTSGNHVVLTVTPQCYCQLQDNRAWNWNIFAYYMFWTHAEWNQNGEWTVQIDDAAPEKIPVQVDRFGQTTKFDFSGKVKDEQELKDDLERDREYYGSLKTPQRDDFGGLLEVTLPKTGFFRLDKWNGHDTLVTPEGHPVYHLAVCSIAPCDDYTYVKGREAIYDWLPSRKDALFGSAWAPNNPDSFSFYQANYIRKTGKPFKESTWVADIHNRLKAFGFNAHGAFGGHLGDCVRDKMPLAGMLPLSSWSITGPIATLADPFATQTAVKLDQLFAPLAKNADNPWIVGYFLSNERAFSEVPRKIASLSGKEACKREFVQGLKDKYNTIQAFNQAWALELPDWEAALNASMAVKTPAAQKDTADFAARYYEAYFKLIHDTFRKYDANHLLLGDRFLPAETASDNVVAACGKYNDVFSINYYKQTIDGDFLKKLSERAGGKPLMLSEWSFGTSEQGLSGGCINVKDQVERGKAYRNYVEQSASLPFVVGTEFFTNHDQALTGRYFQYYNGENMNTGIFNVADRPYKDFAVAICTTNWEIYDVVGGKRAPFAWSMTDGDKRAKKTVQVPHALPGQKVDGIRESWPGRPSEHLGKENLQVGNNSGQTEGDFWLCWDENMLYVFASVVDKTPCMGKDTLVSYWDGDCLELFIGTEKLEQDGKLVSTDKQLCISALPGAGAHWANQTMKANVPVAVLPFADNKGWTLEAGVPWSELGVRPSKGIRLRFDVALDNGNGIKRLDQFVWNGDANNSNERTGWGFALLVD